MQFLFSVIADSSDLADADEMAAIDVHNAGLKAQGHWVFAAGLGGPAGATTIDNRRDAGIVTDGPFTESKEFVAAFWIIEATDLDQALALATDGSKACNARWRCARSSDLNGNGDTPCDRCGCGCGCGDGSIPVHPFALVGGLNGKGTVPVNGNGDRPWPNGEGRTGKEPSPFRSGDAVAGSAGASRQP